jgi:hypothetical protein
VGLLQAVLQHISLGLLQAAFAAEHEDLQTTGVEEEVVGSA